MTAESSPVILTILAVIQALMVAGIVAAVGLAFRINGEVREIKGLLDHPDNGVTARAKATDEEVRLLGGRMQKQETKQETEHVALERRVGHLETRFDDFHRG